MSDPNPAAPAIKVGEQVLAGIKAILAFDVQALATAIGTWDTARQVIRTVATGVAGAAMQGTMNAVMAKYKDVPLSPAVLADMEIRNIGGTFDKVAEAAYSGIDENRFNLLVQDTGESYGIDQALGLWWRGLNLPSIEANPGGTTVGSYAYSGGPMRTDLGITPDELDTVIYYSRVRDQFIGDLKLLAQRTMSEADAIGTAVKGRLSPADAKQLFVAAGGIEDQFELLYESAGDSVGVVHAVELEAHGLITPDELQQVIYQSRVNPRFYDIALKANVRWLPPYQIKAAVSAGTIDTATAMTWLMEQGYPKDQAAAFAAASGAGTIAKPKAETEAMILDDYEAQIITETEATDALKSLGYEATAIPFILDYLVAKRVLTLRTAAINRVRTAYVEHLVDDVWVRTELAKLGLPEPAIAQSLTTWQIEQATNVKRLTAAQVGKLAEDGVIGAGDAIARWVQMGYSTEEAQLLTYIYEPGSKAAPGTVPKVTTLPPTPLTGA